MKKLIICFAATLLWSCNQPERHQSKLEILVQYQVVGYYHHCDSYKKVGDAYILTKYNGETETIIPGEAAIIIKKNTDPNY